MTCKRAHMLHCRRRTLPQCRHACGNIHRTRQPSMPRWPACAPQGALEVASCPAVLPPPVADVRLAMPHTTVLLHAEQVLCFRPAGQHMICGHSAWLARPRAGLRSLTTSSPRCQRCCSAPPWRARCARGRRAGAMPAATAGTAAQTRLRVCGIPHHPAALAHHYMLPCRYTLSDSGRPGQVEVRLSAGH